MCDKKGKVVKAKDKEDDTMSAAAENFVYRVGCAKKTEKKVPVISKKKMEAFRADIAKYRRDK